MEDALHVVAENIALLVNFLAMAAIAIGSIKTAGSLFWLLLSQASQDRLRPVWLGFGRWLVAGLSFQLAADIVETTIAPSWEDVGKLAAIAAIRTFLSYFLDRDTEPLREREAEDCMPEAGR